MCGLSERLFKVSEFGFRVVPDSEQSGVWGLRQASHYRHFGVWRIVGSVPTTPPPPPQKLSTLSANPKPKATELM